LFFVCAITTCSLIDRLDGSWNRQTRSDGPSYESCVRKGRHVVEKIPTLFERDDRFRVVDRPRADCTRVFDGEAMGTEKLDGQCPSHGAFGPDSRETTQAQIQGRFHPVSNTEWLCHPVAVA
jgi:hypothetical protein